MVTPHEMSNAEGFNYVVEISTNDGTPVFKGTVSQQGDFVHLHRYPHGSVATLRVHDMAAAAKKEEPIRKYFDPRVVKS